MKDLVKLIIVFTLSMYMVNYLESCTTTNGCAATKNMSGYK